MTFLRLILKNVFRHKLRTALTVGGIAVVVTAFALVYSSVRAWYAGVEASAQNRLIARHAASLSIHLPLAYRERIAAVVGVTGVSYVNWFGGVYRDAKTFFAQFAVEPASYLDLYPEFLLSPGEREAFIADRRGCIIGRKLAAQYGWKIGDAIPIQGTTFPGDWNFVVRGIYAGAEPATDETLLLFHWEHLNERRKTMDPDRADRVGWYVIRIANPEQAATIAEVLDAGFAHSLAETRTETEQAYRMGFVVMSGALILALKTLALTLNSITLLVLANTLVMTVHERTREYALLKTLGFQPGQLAGLILGEALTIVGLGVSAGVGLTLLVGPAFGAFLTGRFGGFFRVFELHAETLVLSGAAALLAGLVAAAVPAIWVMRIRITDGLRHVG